MSAADIDIESVVTTVTLLLDKHFHDFLLLLFKILQTDIVNLESKPWKERQIGNDAKC